MAHPGEDHVAAGLAPEDKSGVFQGCANLPA
jgi:hypothetical protein